MAFEIEKFDNTLWQYVLGDIYVSSVGDDTADGSPKTPFRTIQFAISQASNGAIIVVGSGEYSEELNGQSKSLTIIGDGLVQLRGNGQLNKGFVDFNTTNSVIKNLEVHDFLTACVDTGFQQISNCIIDGNVSSFSGVILKSVLKNCVLTTLGNVEIIKSSLLNISSVGAALVSKLSNTLIDSSSSLTLDVSTLNYLDYCNQEPGSTITIDTTDYLSHTALNTAYSNYQINGKSLVIDFINQDKGLYTLGSSNVLNSSGEFGLSIGAFEKSVSYSFDANPTNSSYSLSNIQLNTLEKGLELTSGSEFGFLETAIIDFASIKKVGKLNLRGVSLFEMLPSNVSNNSIYANYQPRTLGFEMKFGKTLAELNSKQYLSFFFHTTPKVDHNGISNGSINFNKQTATSISARYVQIRFKLNTTDFFLLQENLDCLMQEDGNNILWKLN